MRAYSNDLRQKVIDAYQRGEGSMRQLAERFSVSLNFVWLLIEGPSTINIIDYI